MKGDYTMNLSKNSQWKQLSLFPNEEPEPAIAKKLIKCII